MKADFILFAILGTFCTTNALIGEDFCLSPPETGPCKAAFPRYFYNSRIGKCRLFIYGGCKGNDNNFHTKELCESRCPHPPQPLPPSENDKCTFMTIEDYSKPGCTKESYGSIGYNRVKDECEDVYFGACEFVYNTFNTVEECAERCVVGCPKGVADCGFGRFGKK